jgi:hypothetical protein
MKAADARISLKSPGRPLEAHPEAWSRDIADTAPGIESGQESERRIYPTVRRDNTRRLTEVGVPGAVSRCDRPSGGPRIRFQAFTRWTIVGFPIEAPARVRIATFSGRHPFLSSRP